MRRLPSPTPTFTVTVAMLACALSGPAAAQVHYFPDGRPWKQTVKRGPDADAGGWFYNLGVTGIRVQLMPEEPKHLLVKYVIPRSPAARRVRAGDVIVGAGDAEFATEHRNGYGMDKFGPDGPILEFANALEASQSRAGRGKLTLDLVRKGKRRSVTLDVGTRDGVYGPDYPMDCPKSKRIYARLCDVLAENQRADGSWGGLPQNLFAPLALLASGKSKYRRALKKAVEWHARTTKAVDSSSLINWRYMAAAVVMSEYYLATRERWVLPELVEVYHFLFTSQYTDMAQIDPKTRRDRPRDLPDSPLRAHGGWGHNPGFEGYGPISMITGQGALAFALMRHCGVDVDRKRHEAAYAFLERASGANAYVWYEDRAAGPQDWADMGRTGAAAIANQLSPYRNKRFRERALAHARIIGAHPESFPDTHGSPIMGMGFAAMGARVDPPSFRRLMDANRWWFTLAECPDGTFYYQPNRDNAGYGPDSRLTATAVVAFILSMQKPALCVTGKPLERN